MKRKIIALMLIIALAALAAGGAVGLSATPASAMDYSTIELSGPTTGKVGQILTYTATLQRCTETPAPVTPPGGAPGPGPQVVCGPASEQMTFYAWRLKPRDDPYAEYPATSNAQGVATTNMPFALAGEYRVGANYAGAVKAFTVTITEDKQPSTPPGSNSGAGNSGDSSSGGGSSGGGSQATPASGGTSPSPTTSSNNTAAVFGLEQASASAGSASGWMWILALGIIILLAIIVAVLLLTRRHPREEEYTPEDANDYYRTGRR